MKAYYDLHIHSALSPCADNDMTPNNIINMAALKGLDVVAICDHNSTFNVRAAARVAKEVGICFIPGIELNTAEEVHLLVYFDDVDKAEAFGDMAYDALPAIQNEEMYFGNQLVLDEQDEVSGKKEKLLISALPFDLKTCFELAREYDGVAVPAHVNKYTDSILANLGFFPTDIAINTIEVMKSVPLDMDTSAYQVIYNSDAHMLPQISERENSLEVDSIMASGIIEKIQTSK
ncbi:PHP domain-containing protein [Christensenellaceae bacterium OttesenSCG-928-K19]|nr:PHP domain-containing protein [Christensenellaceae bacterium OttesenSCG-928-K19]